MSELAISVTNLAKCYRLGVATERHDTALATINSWLRAPLRNLRYLSKLRHFDDEEDGDDVVWALRDVNFEVRRGEVVGIIGRNGAGKSTLLKLLSRITDPTRGGAEIYGRVASLLEVGTGFHPELTGRENVFLNGTILGMSKAEVEAKFDEIAAFSEIDRFLDTPIKRYSSGMRVRLAFAVAAHLDPEILIIDEVLAVGDVGFQKKCLGKMDSLARGGRTVLFVSHNMGAIQSLCSRAILIESGRIVADDDTANVIARYYQASGGTVAKRDLADADLHRSGDQRIRITGIRLLDADGRESTKLVAGRDLTIELAYTNRDDVAVCNAGISFISHYGTPIARMTMRYDGFSPADLGRSGTFLCTIPSLPLPVGTYCVDVFVNGDNRPSDHLSNIMNFDVTSSVFYATNRGPSAAESAALFAHQWAHESDA